MTPPIRGREGNPLATQAQAGDQVAVTVNIVGSEVLQKALAATNEKQQTTTRVVIVLVLLEVLGELLDADGQQCNLSLRRTGVSGVQAVLCKDFFLLLSA